MECPHCRVAFFVNWEPITIDHRQRIKSIGGSFNEYEVYYRGRIAVCPSCSGAMIDLFEALRVSGDTIRSIKAFPSGGKFLNPSAEVPSDIASDFSEANQVLSLSPKASAALARRCLQSVLMSQGYKSRDLVQQVEAALNETEAKKALPLAIRQNLDAIRNFGNFSAHPLTDKTTLQVVDVEEGEAEWCLEILQDLFEHYYVGPAEAEKKRDALNAKLLAAGKPQMKQ